MSSVGALVVAKITIIFLPNTQFCTESHALVCS